MAFWKKKEMEPWDRPEKEEKGNSFQEYVDQWNAVVEREKEAEAAKKKAQEEYENALFESVSSMDCPWCGRGMDKAYIYGQRGVNWQQKLPKWTDWMTSWPLDQSRGYKIAWYCPECQRMALDVKRPYDYKTPGEEER